MQSGNRRGDVRVHEQWRPSRTGRGDRRGQELLGPAIRRVHGQVRGGPEVSLYALEMCSDAGVRSDDKVGQLARPQQIVEFGETAKGGLGRGDVRFALVAGPRAILGAIRSRPRVRERDALRAVQRGRRPHVQVPDEQLARDAGDGHAPSVTSLPLCGLASGRPIPRARPPVGDDHCVRFAVRRTRASVSRAAAKPLSDGVP